MRLSPGGMMISASPFAVLVSVGVVRMTSVFSSPSMMTYSSTCPLRSKVQPGFASVTATRKFWPRVYHVLPLALVSSGLVS